jgi:hypothetical protein
MKDLCRERGELVLPRTSCYSFVVNLMTLDVDNRIILKWIFVGCELDSCRRIGTGGVLLSTL